MSYVVFALKWRPNTFEEIVGQEHITTTLKNAISKNRLAHAYLFAGPRGVGKTSTARILAKSLNCKNGSTVEPCQVCSSCLEISQARNLDVIEIDGASNRGIDEVRVLRENVKFAPTGGKFKIYIIDEVHMLTTEAFNALLKTLEEPPEFVKFIFATTQPHKIPPTILSRCQRFDFKRIPLLKIIEQLNKIVSKEKISIDNDVLFAIAKASDGSLRDAEALLDQLVSFSKDKVSVNDVISVLGIVQQEVLFDITNRIIQKDARGALEILNNIIDAGKDISLFLTNLIEHFRNLMVSKVAKGDPTLIDLPSDICARLAEQAQAFTLEEILSAFNVLVNTQEMAKRLDSLRIPLEISLIKLAQNKIKLDNPVIPKPTDKKEEKNEDKVISKNIESEIHPDFNKIEPKTNLSLDDVKGSWQDIISNLSKIKMSVATYLSEGAPIQLEANNLTVSFPKNYALHKEALERKENKLIIEKTTTDLLKTNVRLNFVLSNEEAHKDKSDTSPLMKTILDTFKARTIKE
jgi:DNA polymerase-3 subunit gamma/tau